VLILVTFFKGIALWLPRGFELQDRNSSGPTDVRVGAKAPQPLIVAGRKIPPFDLSRGLAYYSYRLRGSIPMSLLNNPVKAGLVKHWDD
jgi:hypothetical protein